MAPPDNQLWVDNLRWCICVMDVGDPDLGFAASLLSYSVKHGGLTEKQARYGDRLLERLVALYERGQLPAQLAEPRETLACMQPAGSA